MEDLTRQLAARKLHPDEWGDAFDAVLFRGHVDAYVLGRQRAGDLSPEGAEDRVLGLDAKDSQAEHLQDFVDCLTNGDPRYFLDDGSLNEQAVNVRARLYAARFRGTANEAFTQAGEDDDEYLWELGATEHCPDCLELHAISVAHPFTQDTMLGHPGDGQTECNVNCDCRLMRIRDGLYGFARPDIYLA